MDASERRNYRNGWVTLLLLILPLNLLSNVPPPDPHSLALRIAERYGLDSFPRVESMHFVFNVHYKGHDVAREWTWFPKEDSVIYKGKDPAGAMMQAAYSRRNQYSLAAESVKAIDKMFINDQYWLLFPYHLVWDKGTTMEASAMPPGKNREAYRVTVIYPSQGGYTPGDAYDLYVDSSGTVMRWTYRKSNSDKPTRESMWSEPVPEGGLNLSLVRPGMGDDFKLSFSDVKVVSR
jgi:hypothetical protein